MLRSSPDLPRPEPADPEDPAFLREQLITCIGNKRALLAPIEAAVLRVRERLSGRKLNCLDAFAGSGVVSRLLKRHAARLVSNDLEPYAATIARCFLTNRGRVDFNQLRELVDKFNRAVGEHAGQQGLISRLYAPKDDTRIRRGERVFYTQENARRLDAFRQLIGELTAPLQPLLLGPLLSAASIHANTGGVFKGFYKNRETGIGQFGGTGADALQRIRGRIHLEVPLLSRFECEIEIHQQDANTLAPSLRELDFAYLDPPYNQHPYGSNYFMLNLLVDYREPAEISPVSGIPKNWNRSDYNRRSASLSRLRELIATLDAKFLLVSFNDEGFILFEEMRAMLASFGKVAVFEEKYNVYRGSRNLHGRRLHLVERLFLLEKS